MSPETASPGQSPLHRWVWRWHGYAGLFVIPFIFYMSLTGLPYVWEHELEDVLHPEYRALTPQGERISYELQLNVARSALPNQPLQLVKVDADPRHATQFTFGDAADPTTVAVSPYTGQVVSVIREWTRLSFAGIQLHGLAFIKPYGSWLIELLACWGIVLCVTGVYLWWPRGTGWARWGVFLPRLRSGGRTRWRDLHAVTGFYFACILALYLMTGLPWTAFWGGQLLTSIQNATGQAYPANMTGNAGLKSVPPTSDAKLLPLDAFIAFGLRQKLPGHLEIEIPAASDATVHVRNRVGNSTRETHWQLDRFTAQPLGVTAWSQIPLTQQAVALGIDTHEGSLFGRPTQLLSTALACAFMFLSGAAAVMWWRRRPQGHLDFPRPVPCPALSYGVRALLVFLGIAMPLLGLSFFGVALLSQRSGVE
jgi:uncharacterized iron-regulated membrane protein